MVRRARVLTLAAILALGSSAIGSASIYMVANTNDSGAGSLREAIAGANSHVGADWILFDSSLLGKTVYPLTALPSLSDSGTLLDGNIDTNGTPDITIDGKNLPTGQNGLMIGPTASGCTITGFAIVRCPQYGISIQGADNNVVKTCHLGVTRGGGAVLLNGSSDIRIDEADGNLIGGDEAKERNIIAGGNPAAAGSAGVDIDTCTNTKVQHNYFGLNRAGSAALAAGQSGVWIEGGSGNTVGGVGSKYRNLFGTSAIGVVIRGSTHDNLVAGNYFGLAANGSTAIPLSFAGVALQGAAHNNTIGGTTAGARNVFAGGSGAKGVRLDNLDTQGNVIRGNYFGVTAAGTAQRTLYVGVMCLDNVGANTIGGSAAGARNYFCSTHGVIFRYCGADSVVRGNTFGVRPDGGAATGVSTGIQVDDVAAIVGANTFANAATGIDVQDAGNPRATGNSFTACDRAVWLESAGGKANLGNLGNTPTSDDGGNVFAASNTWTVYNQSANLIRAEGNDFGTTSKAKINAKVYDRQDDATCGRVDFDPLIGGVSPTGDAGSALALTGASAVSSASGAEIVFTLSAPATVTVEVLNIAGRLVATVAASKSATAGLQRLAWNGASSQGLRAPNGMYLVRITACDPEGAHTQALLPLRLQRP